MEHHGENPLQNIVAVIPARFASTRLPGKLLLDVCGKPLILHTLARAAEAKSISRVVVATDDDRIFKVVTDSGAEAVMTAADHQSGSDRIAEVAAGLPEGSIIVNVQGDEPLISPETIDRAVWALIGDPGADVATVWEAIGSVSDVFSPNIVKVVVGANGDALYFSRSPIPFLRDEVNRAGGLAFAIKDDPGLIRNFKKHTGLYVYRREFLLRYAKMPSTALERAELLEQLRILENGGRIKIVESAQRSIGVDTVDDLKNVQRILEEQSVEIRDGRQDDIPQVARVHVESWQRSFAGLAPQDYLDSMSVEKREKVFGDRMKESSYRMLVAESKTHGIVGFIDFGKPDFENYGYDARIFSFYFLPEFQRRGFGERLFDACVDRIAGAGFGSVCLDTLEMSPYRRFYEKHGGTEVARDKHHLGGKDFATVIYGWSDLQSR